MILGEAPISDINGSFGSTEKKFSINFSKANTKFPLSLHYNGVDNYLFVNGKEIYNFKADNEKVDFPTQYCLGRIFNKFGALNIHKYLMVKSNK